ncbi:MAG: tRNA 2-thiouridine(34) synthase MnmA [Patescibacteria group bacterium]
MTTPPKKSKIFVALSGGVDSAVAALLLQRMGHQVTGVFMKNWSDPLADECPWEREAADARRVCQSIGIPFRIETFEEEYRERVVTYLIQGYRSGNTPNPDMLCNREIKFNLFLRKAISLGADCIATGHYVRKKTFKTQNTTVHQLFQARDRTKDQSYFLAMLSQSQIRRAFFPLGNMLKSEVRTVARQAGLHIYAKKDSQGICFIGKVRFQDFIRQFIPPAPGDIITTDGAVIGRHDGVAYFTIGQRHGINVGGGTPYYVVGKNFKKRQLIVARGQFEKSLYQTQCRIAHCSWVSGVPHFPFECSVRIRYRQPLQPARIDRQRHQMIISFSRRQRAVTPGQFAVAYRANGQMLGGGIIR